jgi:S1-C subfamily serine protease
MPSIRPTERIPITQVQVVQKRSFLSIKDGYIVSKQSGFGIVDGKGEVGSLVIANGRAAGIVVSIGRDSERGFMRMVAWGDLNNVFRRLEKLQKDQLYLGISAAALEDRDGLAVARVTPVSPFANKLQMGDIILKANNQTITQADDLKRIIMFSGNEIVLTVEREGKNFDLSVNEIL